MQVDEGRMADTRSLPAQDLAQGPVGPDRRAAAIEHALGIAILARGDGALKRHDAMALAIGLQRGIGRRLAVDPVARADRLAQLVIGGIDRMRPRVIDEIAVEIDIVLGHPAHPGEAAGVDGMDQKDRRAAGHLRRQPALQQPHLEPRAAEAFDAMGPRHDDQQALGFLWPKPRRLRRELDPARTGRGIVMGVERRTGTCRGFAKGAARLGIIP